MSKINLTAKNETERRILAHLEANASDALVEKIAASKKTLGDAVRHCTDQARKMGSGCVMVDDATVFGWVIHYFEDVAGAPAKLDKAEKAAREEAEAQSGDADKEDGENTGLFGDVDFFGGAK